MPKTKQVRQKSSLLKKQKKSAVPGHLAKSESDSLISYSTENEKLTSLLIKEYESVEEFIEEYETYYNGILELHKKSYENARERIKEEINLLPQLLKSKNINDDDIVEGIVDQNKDPNVNVPRIRPSRSRTPDSFKFKRPKTPSISGIRKSTRKRSVSASAASSASASRINPSGFKTPQMNCRRLPPNTVITPKISDTPISVMRRPQHGEVAVSMSGSPLMVGPIASEEIPTVNVPLQDGRVFSIMPEPGAPPLDLPQIDEVTKQYLKTLRAHLQIMAPDTP